MHRFIERLQYNRNTSLYYQIHETTLLPIVGQVFGPYLNGMINVQASQQVRIQVFAM